LFYYKYIWSFFLLSNPHQNSWQAQSHLLNVLQLNKLKEVPHTIFRLSYNFHTVFHIHNILKRTLKLNIRENLNLKYSNFSLYISVYHFPLCYLIISFSVGIYRQNTTSTISVVFIVYLATWHVCHDMSCRYIYKKTPEIVLVVFWL
jgi:hypothetical protein